MCLFVFVYRSEGRKERRAPPFELELATVGRSRFHPSLVVSLWEGDTEIGIIDGLWRGEGKCIDPKAGDADLWIKIWEELHLLMSKEI